MSLKCKVAIRPILNLGYACEFQLRIHFSAQVMLNLNYTLANFDSNLSFSFCLSS